jgi:hypothetical protein
MIRGPPFCSTARPSRAATIARICDASRQFLASARNSGTLENVPYDPEIDRLPEFNDPDAVADLFFLVGVLANNETDSREHRDARARLDLNLAAAQARTHMKTAESAERLTGQLVRATYVLAVCTLALVAATIVLAIRAH